MIGNLCGDPVARATQSGKTVAQFTIAVNRRDKGEVDFFRISAWDKLGDNCAKWLIKGKKVAVVGSISATAYIAQDGKARASLEVTAQYVEFLSPAGETPVKAPETAQKAPSGFVDVSGQESLTF